MNVLQIIHHHLVADSGAPGSHIALAHALRLEGHDGSTISFEDLPRSLPLRAKHFLFPAFAGRAIIRNRDWADLILSAAGDEILSYPRLLATRSPRPTIFAKSHGLEHLHYIALQEEASRAGERLSLRFRMYHRGFRQPAVAASLRRADFVLALNRDEARFMVERLRVRADRVEILPNGLHRDFFAMQPVVREPIRGGTIGIVHIGSYEPSKGSRYMARAFTVLLEEFPDVLVSFLGTGVPRDTVHAEYPMELRHRIRVIERFARADLASLVRNDHIIVNATPREGFGMALVEGMAIGLAAVGPAAGGPADILSKGVGLLVPASDADALHQACRRLITDPELLHRLSQRSVRAARAYSWTDGARRVHDLVQLARRRLDEPRSRSGYWL